MMIDAASPCTSHRKRVEARLRLLTFTFLASNEYCVSAFVAPVPAIIPVLDRATRTGPPIRTSVLRTGGRSRNGRSLFPRTNTAYQSTHTPTRLLASNKKSKRNNSNDSAYDDDIESEREIVSSMQRPKNEFSRTYRIDTILSGGQRQRDYNVELEATQEELIQLARRFDLKNIYTLQAQLSMRRERSSSKGVQVEGEVNARLVQVCVRTGELFDVDVQFPLFAVVRPIAANAAAIENDLDDIPQELLDFQLKAKKRDRVKTPNLKDMDMMELQNLLQDFDVEDDVMEDEAIYSNNGKLDVGELVAQLFWLKLDPYPKKPGSSPVQSSISG